MSHVDCSEELRPLTVPFYLLRLSMMDLVVAMAPLADEATMTKTFELIRPQLEVRLQFRDVQNSLSIGH